MNDERATWVEVATLPTGLEADMARSALEEEGIPVLVQSNSAGIFGLSFQGNVTGGFTLQVPSPELERARELLALDTDDVPQADGDAGSDEPSTP